MSDTCYQIVCDRNHKRVVLADVWHDPECDAAQRYEQEMRRWDRHASGEEPIADQFGNPYPRSFRPYLYRHSSRAITIVPRPSMFVPELVDRSGPDNAGQRLRWLVRRRAQGQPDPHNGYVRVVGYEMGDTEYTDGHGIRIKCELCERTRGKSTFAPISPDTLAIVLDRIGPRLDTETLPVRDHSGNLGETVEVRVVTLYELRKELGGTPRG